MRSFQQIVRIGFVCLLVVVAMFVCESRRVAIEDQFPIYRDASLPDEERITDLLSRMTMNEKIGQMALVEQESITNAEDITDYGLGALLSGGGSGPDTNTPERMLVWRLLVRRRTQRALEMTLLQ